MKRFLFLFVALTLLAAILLLSPASPVQADVKPPPSEGQGSVEEGSAVLPEGAVVDQTVRNSPRGIGQIYLLQETFEGSFPEDNGWTVFDCDGSTNGEYFWDDTSYKWWAGAWSAWPANGGANGFDLNDSSVYPNNMCTWMVDGPYDLRGVASGSLYLKYWLNTELNYDFIKYFVSPDSTNWYGYVNSGTTAGWVDGTIDLANVPTYGNVLGDSSVWVAIIFSSDGSYQYQGAYVDNVYVEVVKDCYYLDLSVGLGHGTAPTASPTSSSGCSTGYYTDGEVITLTAHPDAGWYVSEWGGTANDSLNTLTNNLTFTTGGAVVFVSYSTKLTYTSLAGADGYILESGENSNIGGTLNATATTLLVGDNAQDKQYRSILSFDLTSMPDNAYVTGVTLKLKLQGTIGTNPFNTHGPLYVDVRKGVFGGNPALAVSDFQAAASKNAFGVIPKTPVGGWYYKVWGTTMTPYLNLVTGFTQFRLRFSSGDDDDLFADYLKFYSGNAPLAYRPKLIIEYTIIP